MSEERVDTDGDDSARPRPPRQGIKKRAPSRLYKTIVETGPRTESRLAEAAEGIRRGDPSVIRIVYPGRLATAPAGIEPAADECKSYLPPNRLTWWDLWPDHVPGTGALRDVLLNEFCSPLATVVGSDVAVGSAIGDLSPLFAGRRISWDQGVVDVAAPNATIGLEFSVRGALPGSTVLLELLPVKLGPNLGLRDDVVLFSDQNGVREANPLQVPLFFEFAVPQRAVALEYGVWGEGDFTMDPGQVELLAFGDDGLIVTSSGNDLHRNDPISALTVNNVIGVRAAKGDIRTVELRFYLSADPRIQPRPYYQPHLVRRIWHEPLPPAAVTQGTMGFEFYPHPPEPGTIGEPPLPDNEKGPKTVSLPFRCNRALVLMRGFKFKFLDEKPYPVNTLAAGIVAPPVFEVDRRGSITFAPHGELSPLPSGIPGVIFPSEPPPFRVLIYYTVVAWDADQLEFTSTRAEIAEDPREGKGQNAPVPLRMSISDPCTNLQPGSDPSERCGPLYGGLQDFRYHLYPLPWGPFAQNVDQFGLAVGQMGGGTCDLSGPGGLPGTMGVGILGYPDLARAEQSINWNLCTLLAGGDLLYLRDCKGEVLTGRSLHLRSQYPTLNLVFPTVGPRPKPDTFFATFKDNLAWLISGDMAFLGLGIVFSQPNGPLRELEIELSGMDYDGTRFSWQLGGGVNTLPVVSNDDPERLLVGFPALGALIRKSANPDTRLAVQDMLFN
jgi:hypothetical protein